MKCAITIAMDNDAFADVSMGDELARILREVAEYTSGKGNLSLAYTGWVLHDINGNAVGQITIREL